MSTENNQNKDNNVVLNVGAKEYVPKKKNPENKVEVNSQTTVEKKDEEPKKIEFNLNAKEFKPKMIEGMTVQLEEDDDDEDAENDDVIDDLINQELDDPMQIDEEDESDEDKWFPKFKDCSCCTGYIYKCSGEVCKSLGVCFCKAQEDYDPDV